MRCSELQQPQHLLSRQQVLRQAENKFYSDYDGNTVPCVNMFAPIFTAIASFATAPALIFIGFLMFTTISELNFHIITMLHQLRRIFVCGQCHCSTALHRVSKSELFRMFLLTLYALRERT